MSFDITYINKKDLKTISVSGWQAEETISKLKEQDNLVLFLDDHYIGDL